MCGIAGIVDTRNGLSFDDIACRDRMVTALAHRGPDGRGRHDRGPVALGHARLSIIGLESGAQPLSNEDGSVVVVANGEIYNHAELRRDLVASGHRFSTESDCEVLVHLWEELGPGCVDRLEGMFAFVIFDHRKEILFGARDRFGQKPLFYSHHDGRLTFASEIKALLACPWVSSQIDHLALDQFLFYQFVPPPRTMIEGVDQLRPGHWMKFESGRFDTGCYWPSQRQWVGEEQQVEFATDLPEDRFGMAVSRAVASHLISDVPVGVFLSGGIDSSLVAMLAARHSAEPLQSFSIGFPGTRYDETPFAMLASRAAGTHHRVFNFQSSDVPGQLAEAAEVFDQPVADKAILPLMALSREASQFVKVVLTGDGGDEINAGYEKYRRVAAAQRWQRWLARRLSGWLNTGELARHAADPIGWRRMKSRLALKLSPEEAGRYFKGFWEGWWRQRLYTDQVRESIGSASPAEWSIQLPDWPNSEVDPLARLARWDRAGSLAGDLLIKTDYATMAYGLEARAPLLDHRLTAVADRLPRHRWATVDQTKVALREIASELLPAELVERPKRGFGLPLKKWLQTDLADWTRELLLDSPVTAGELFEASTIETILDEHTSGHRNHTGRIYTLIVFELWHRCHVAGASTSLPRTDGVAA